ncbi:hypothetical protein FE783_04700 [Paenibacillus mesophilus]|uniref:hypothetical protein n=1 Tax=Paenibacillus mesophilus TaxID=2582849 RepID=UPI00110E7BE6|nr:hypothetical protein [Paenibacillus mesophilus]TMV52244.1 hypothetical protein FE783_04700 [Paenibacillus mesophilus]
MKRAVAAIAVVFLLFVPVLPVHGLSCAQPRPVVEEFASSELVFRGTVSGKKRTEAGVAVTFTVHEVWKGTASRKVELLESDMWLEFQTGKQYLVYVDEDRDARRANLCGNTKLWDRGIVDAASFGVPSIAKFAEPVSAFTVWRIAALIGAAAAAYITYKVWRRRRLTR